MVVRFSIFSIFIGINLLLSGCSSSTVNINDWQRMNLKQSVKQIDIITYNTYEDLMKKQNALKSLIRFNEQGLISKSARFAANGQTNWSKYTYSNDSVWVVESIESNRNLEAPQNYWLYKINDQGAQLSITSILIDSSINFHIDMDINAQGTANAVYYSQQRNPSYVPCTIEKEYNEQQQLIIERTYSYDPTTQDCATTFKHSKFTYNEQGDVLREVMYDVNDQKIGSHSYKYTYDDTGNWTQRLHYAGDTPQEVIMRTFSYFDTKNPKS